MKQNPKKSASLCFTYFKKLNSVYSDLKDALQIHNRFQPNKDDYVHLVLAPCLPYGREYTQTLLVRD
jgi:hypothetical protein